MPELKPDTISLVVTSPPYWNAIDYNSHAAEGFDRNFRTGTYEAGYQAYDEYLDWCGRIAAEIFRVVRPGGFCAVVLGTFLQKGRHYPVPFDFTQRAMQVGWDFHQDIIWHKTTAGVRRAGSVIQQPFPGYFHPNIMTEYILVFRKPGEPIYRALSAAKREGARVDIDKLFVKEIANNVWHIPPVPPRYIEHPAPFPEEIPHRLIRLYSYPGDAVLDPFAGSGQTLKVAHALGRRWVGYEIVPKYARYAVARVGTPLNLRELQLVAEWAKMPLEGSAIVNGRAHRGRQLRLISDESGGAQDGVTKRNKARRP